MGVLLFTILSVAIAFIWVPRGLVRMPVTPRVLNLPVIFSALFLMYYTQHIFIREVVFDTPVQHWLSLTDPQRDMALLYLLSYFLVFWLAYTAHTKKQKIQYSITSADNLSVAIAIIILTYASLVLYIETTGGLLKFITDHRENVYLDQWSRSGEAVFTNRVRIATGFIFTAAAVFGGYLAGRDEKAGLWKNLLYFSLLLPAVMVKIALLSRGFLLPVVLFFLAKNLVSAKRYRYLVLKLFVLSFLVLISAVLTLQARADEAIIFEGVDNVILFISKTINGISAYFDTVALSQNGSGRGLPRVLLELSPIPSFIYSSPYETNLTTLVFGRRSGSSTPMPFIGETFFNMGWGGLALAYLQGFMAALVNSKVANPAARDHVWWLMLYIMTVYSFLYMPHSGMRACTRPLVWVFTIYGMWTLLRIIAPKKRLALERFPAGIKRADESADTH